MKGFWLTRHYQVQVHVHSLEEDLNICGLLFEINIIMLTVRCSPATLPRLAGTNSDGSPVSSVRFVFMAIKLDYTAGFS